MNAACIGLIVITIFSIGIIIFVGPYIKKVTNCWYFWMGIGILLFIYVCVCRFGDEWEELNNFFKHGILPNSQDRDITISRGLLLDICPFVCFTLLIAIIIDPTRKIAQVIAPFALFGGLVTICAINQDYPTFDGQYIFVGNELNPMYFMMHYINVVIGTLVLVSTPRFKTYFIFSKNKIWQKINISNWFFGLGFAIFYYSYVAICMTALNVSQNVSGLNANDWNGGEYSGVMKALNSSWQVAAALGFIASIISISLIIFLFGYLQQVKKYYWNNQWNKKKWWSTMTYIPSIKN